MSELSKLQPLERIERYRALAQQARRHAAGTKDDGVRQSFLFVAEQWEKLARDASERHPLMLIIEPISIDEPLK